MALDDRIGTLVAGKYKLEAPIGRGGMGMVYRATHAWTGRACAVKYLHPEHAQDSMSVARFLREARAAATVRHPNAVDVLDMGQDADGSAYLVLELLEGETLAQRLLAVRPLPLAETVKVLLPVMDALDELHKAGVVHRDFKPANIFLARSKAGMVPKLLDFGVAKVIDSESSTSTTTGVVVGTPAYMAPEQAAGNGDIGPYTDVWAAGAVLYECLTGQLPFAAATPSLMLVNVMTKPFVPVEQIRPDLPLELRRVIEKALAKSVEDRYRSMAEMAQALCHAVELAGPELLGASSAQISLMREQLAPTLVARPDSTGSTATSATTDSYGQSKSWTDANGTGVMQRARQRKRLSLALLGVAAGVLGILVGGQLLREKPADQTPQAMETPAAKAEDVGSSSTSVAPVSAPTTNAAKASDELPRTSPVAPAPTPSTTAAPPSEPVAMDASTSRDSAQKSAEDVKKRRKKSTSSPAPASTVVPTAPEKPAPSAPAAPTLRPVPTVERNW